MPSKGTGKPQRHAEPVVKYHATIYTRQLLALQRAAQARGKMTAPFLRELLDRVLPLLETKR